jgi:YfiH family protein
MNIHQNGQIRYLTFPSLDCDNRIRHGIFQRHGGYSPEPWSSLNLSTTVGDSKENVIQNRILIMRTLDFPEDDFFDVWQIHSTNVVVTDKPRSREQNYFQADAIITSKPGVVLLMRFADCVPIFLYDPAHCVIALVHAGWMGTVQKIAKIVVEKMQDIFGSKAKEIYACIGPSISVEKYPIGMEVAEKIKMAFPKSWKSLILTINDSSHLDLWKSNEIALQEAGIEKIEISNICTATNPADWFSHRAEKGRTGRFGVLFSINK